MITQLLKSLNVKEIATATALALSPQCLIAASLNDGIAAYEKEQFERAFDIFHQYAKKDDPKAQYYLSSLYRAGKGVEQDEVEAFRWCSKAAEEGVLEAQFQLGLMYLQGVGTEEDDLRALDWLWIASDRGYKRATEIMQFVLQNDVTVGC